VTINYSCQKLQVDKKRYQRWVRLNRNTGRYGGGRPGPKKPPHRLAPEEKEDIIKIAKDETYLDLSHRQLAVVASETGQVEASASSFYRVMKREQLMERRHRKPKTPQRKPEVKPDGPNQMWSWDLTYISLGPIFVYLFAIIDVFSRKIVGWHLGFNARVESMKEAWDKASWFRILKYDWLRYKDYVSFDQLKTIIRQFVIVYNTQRYHGAIGYVTPEQKHSGQAEEILKARSERKCLARLHRLKLNREPVSQIEWKKAA